MHCDVSEWRSLTCDGHLVRQLHDDPAAEELAGEVEEVGVVEHDEELGQLPLVGLHGAGVALARVHPAELGVHVNVHLNTGPWAAAGGGRGRGGRGSHRHRGAAVTRTS